MSTQSATRTFGYLHESAVLHTANRLILPEVKEILESYPLTRKERRILEVGCGTGASAHYLQQLGYDVTGIDTSQSGLELAATHFPTLKIFAGSGYDNLAERYGTFPCILSIEVIEHLYDPRLFVQRIFDALDPGGIAIITTPYHGYWKNLTLAMTGKLDAHFTALWDHGHIKFWSIRSLRYLLLEAGFSQVTISRVGRIPALARSMISVAKKPD